MPDLARAFIIYMAVSASVTLPPPRFVAEGGNAMCVCVCECAFVRRQKLIVSLLFIAREEQPAQ